MGGSSLAPEVLQRTFGAAAGYPELIVLDTTDPATILRVENRINVDLDAVHRLQQVRHDHRDGVACTATSRSARVDAAGDTGALRQLHRHHRPRHAACTAPRRTRASTACS